MCRTGLFPRGSEDHLSVGLRVASAFAAVLLVVAALVVLGRARYWTSAALSGVFRWGTWLLVVATALSAVANFASSSKWENLLMGPMVLLLLALLCLVVARGGAGPQVAARAEAAHASPADRLSST